MDIQPQRPGSPEICEPQKPKGLRPRHVKLLWEIMIMIIDRISLLCSPGYVDQAAWAGLAHVFNSSTGEQRQEGIGDFQRRLSVTRLREQQGEMRLVVSMLPGFPPMPNLEAPPTFR